MAPTVVNLEKKLAQVTRPWTPGIVARVNDHDVRVARLAGEFVWHKHDDADELFLVVKGRLTLRFRDGDRELGPGELCVVPKGVEHCPVADEEVEVVLIEPSGTVNTGDAGGDRTVDADWL